MTNAEKKLRADIVVEHNRIEELKLVLVEIAHLPRASSRARHYLDKHTRILTNLIKRLLGLIAEDYGTTIQGVESIINITGISPLNDPDAFMVLMEDYTMGSDAEEEWV
jgi:hypothetical protein